MVSQNKSHGEFFHNVVPHSSIGMTLLFLGFFHSWISFVLFLFILYNLCCLVFIFLLSTCCLAYEVFIAYQESEIHTSVIDHKSNSQCSTSKSHNNDNYS